MGYNNLSELFAATANAIRAKTGGTDPIVANDFPEAIEGIIAGSNVSIKEFVERTFTEISDDSVTAVGGSAFNGHSTLTKVSFPNATQIKSSAFMSCSKLQAANFPAATSLESYAFYYCRALTTVNVSAAKSIQLYAFQGCTSLTTLDFPALERVGSAVFKGCSGLTALILRSTTVCSMDAPDVLTSTPIESGTGYIYVPSALLADYQADSNWSTYAAQLRALEDYTVDGTTTGALDETKI